MSIASQVVILFLVVLVGALCRKLRFFTDETIRGVTQLVVNITLPVLTVYNMQRPFETRVLINFLLTLGLSIVAILAALLGSLFLFRNRPHDKRAVLANLEEVRIVHGVGTGKLRAGIHDFLKKQKHVAEFRLGKYGEGETGVTIVKLK